MTDARLKELCARLDTVAKSYGDMDIVNAKSAIEALMRERDELRNELKDRDLIESDV